MVGKRFYQPCSINGWCVVIFEREQRFPDQACQDMIQGLLRSCQDVGLSKLLPFIESLESFSRSTDLGIRGLSDRPLIKRGNGQGDILGVCTYLLPSLAVIYLALSDSPCRRH